MTTNHYGATATASSWATGPACQLRSCTPCSTTRPASVFPEQVEGILITEKFRGAGANAGQHRRRAVRQRARAARHRGGGHHPRVHGARQGRPDPDGQVGVWLDSPMIDMLSGEGTVEREFPGKCILYKRFGIDISKEPMLIYPTLHYQNGGLEISASGETTVPGLFVAGEVGGGVHGENRLMGNSLLDIIVFGRAAGRTLPSTSRAALTAALSASSTWSSITRSWIRPGWPKTASPP